MPAPTVALHGDSPAFMFPGQGSQYPGMGRDIARLGDGGSRLLTRADEILGYSLSSIMASEEDSRLNRTVYTQPAVFVHSVAILQCMRDRGHREPVMAAGHSLGEYTALYAAGVLHFEEALDLIQIRAVGMDEAQTEGTCGMAAVLGIPHEDVLELVSHNRGREVLEAANFNAPDQTVVSGHVPAVRRLIEEASRIRRCKAVLLPVSSAFHTRLMEPALQALSERLKKVEPRPFRFPVLANATGRPYEQPEQIKHLLLEQLVSPVRWTACMETLLGSGATHFMEIGPARVLTGLLKRINRRAVAVAIGTPDEIQSVTEPSA